MAIPFLVFQNHKIGFQKCLEIYQDPLVDITALMESVMKLIEEDHVTANQTLIRILQPIIDAIGDLEHSEKTLADICKQLITMYRKISEVDVNFQFDQFKCHCIAVLHAQTKVFHP